MKLKIDDQVTYRGNLYNFIYEYAGVAHIKRSGQVVKVKAKDVEPVEIDRRFKV